MIVMRRRRRRHIPLPNSLLYTHAGIFALKVPLLLILEPQTRYFGVSPFSFWWIYQFISNKKSLDKIVLSLMFYLSFSILISGVPPFFSGQLNPFFPLILNKKVIMSFIADEIDQTPILALSIAIPIVAISIIAVAIIFAVPAIRHKILPHRDRTKFKPQA